MATENGTFSYKPTTSGTYTWSFRMKNSGMVAQPASVCYLDNLQVSYPYPYTRIDCDKGQNASYRFGFNGKEKESDLYGDGNAIDFGARVYDGRIGRWMSVDKFKDYFPNHSPYHFAGNSPIVTVDKDGNKNCLYIYIGKSVSSLFSKQDLKLLKIKIGQVWERLLSENQSLTGALRTIYTNDDNLDNLDKTDVLLMLSIPEEMNKGVQSIYYGSSFDNAAGESTPYSCNPSGVWPKKFLTTNTNGIGTHVSLNFIDQVAYAVVHEAIHKISQKNGFAISWGDHDGGFMSADKQSTQNLEEIGKKGIKGAPSNVFKLTNERVRNLDNAIGIYSFNGEKFLGGPKDNRSTSNKSNDSKEKKEKTNNDKKGSAVFNPRF